MTLVELVVVLAIIIVVAAVAFPTFGRLGMFSGDEIGTSSRELYTMLRAARMYAASNRANTALVYTLKNVGTASAPVVVIDGMALARQLNRDDFKVLQGVFTTLTEDDREDSFAVVKEQLGEFQTMSGDTCLVEDNFVTLADEDEDDVDERLKRAGIQRISLYDYGDDGVPYEVEPRRVPPSSLLPDELNDKFPAHVFLPSGIVKTYAQTKPRVQLSVGYLPEVRPNTGDAADEPSATAAIVELYTATGRTKIVS